MMGNIACNVMLYHGKATWLFEVARLTSSHGSSWHDRRLGVVHVGLLFWGSVSSIEAVQAKATQGIRL